jgi:hypothetical protein
LDGVAFPAPLFMDDDQVLTTFGVLLGKFERAVGTSIFDDDDLEGNGLFFEELKICSSVRGRRLSSL